MTTNSRAPRSLTPAEWASLAKHPNVVAVWDLNKVAPRERSRFLAAHAYGATFPGRVQHVSGCAASVCVIVGDGVVGVPMLFTTLRRTSQTRHRNEKRELPK